LITSALWRRGLYPKQALNRVRLRLPRACPPPRGRICLAGETAPYHTNDFVWKRKTGKVLGSALPKAKK